MTTKINEEKAKLNAEAKARRDRRVAAPVPPDLLVLDEAQAARVLGVSLATMQKWRYQKRGGPAWLKLASTRVGYRRATIEAWLAELENGGGAK